MPYVARMHDGSAMFLVCMCPQGKTEWKLFFSDGGDWKRATDSGIGVVECNPVAMVMDDGTLAVAYTESDGKEQNRIVKGTLSSNGFNKESTIPSAVGCAYGAEAVVADGMKVAGIDFACYGYDFLYSVRKFPEGIVVTAHKQDGFDSILIADDGILRRIVNGNGKSLYKPCCLDGEWWTVVTFCGNEPELRYVAKARGVRLEAMEVN